MKIFVIPTSYPNKKNPVADIFIYEQVKALSKLGHRITVLHVSKLPTRDIYTSISKKVHKFREEYCTRYSIEIKTFAEGHFPKINYKNFCQAYPRTFSTISWKLTSSWSPVSIFLRE